MRECHLCTTFKLRTNSFCQQRTRLEVLIKVTSKADRWKGSEKSFTKNWFLILFFSTMSLLSKLLTCPLPTQSICSQLKGCTQMMLYRFDPFPANDCSTFSYSRSFSCALYSGDSSWQVSMKSFDNINKLIKVKLFCLKSVFFFFEKSFLLERKRHFWKKILFLITFFLKKSFGKTLFISGSQKPRCIRVPRLNVHS